MFIKTNILKNFINPLFLFPLTIFVSSFLLFSIQPMIGKIVLPIYGGGAYVWTGVMLFFMTTLLLGYLYVFLLRNYTKQLQIYIHITFSIVCFIWVLFNITQNKLFLSTNLNNLYSYPILQILLNLSTHLSIPCILLATTGTLLQNWYLKISNLRSPFWLYLVSNLGSLLGLISYPFFTERFLTLKAQQSFWLYGFLLYLILLSLVVYIFFNSNESMFPKISVRKIQMKQIFSWFTPAFISTTIMLAVTNQLTLSVTPFPLMWVATLLIYLVSFILAFINKPWYPKDFYVYLSFIFVLLLSIFTFGFPIINFSFYTITILLGLLIICLVCNRELFIRRPEKQDVSIFYLTISLGGAIGSLFISMISPVLFKDIWEYPIILIIFSIFVGNLLNNTNLFFRYHLKIFTICISIGILWLFIKPIDSEVNRPNTEILTKYRNFYGVHKILKTTLENGYKLTLLSGETIHGIEYFDTTMENKATAYFTEDNGIGYAINNHPKRKNKIPIKLGVIGLGTGTITSYCEKGDSITYYELNPQVIYIANNIFTYLKNANNRGCITSVIQGDGRSLLSNFVSIGHSPLFDIFVVDAFTDDSIPTHLITNEAIELYMSGVSEGGVLAFHISNRYIDLKPVLKSIAAHKELYYYVIEKSATWVLLSKYTLGLNSYIPDNMQDDNYLWTDNYSNLIGVFKQSSL